VSDDRTAKEIIREELRMWIDIRDRSNRTARLADGRIETMRKAMRLTNAQLEAITTETGITAP